jgi:serpin B
MTGSRELTKEHAMRRTRTIVLSMLAPLVIASCASATASDPYPPHSDPIVVRPNPDSPDTRDLAAGINNVGYDLFHAVTFHEDSDIVLSPLSIGLAFGMLDLGATDNLATVLDDLFGYPVSGDARWSAFNMLEQLLVTQPGTTTPGPDEPVPPIVRIANREFHDTNFSPVAGYDEQLMRWFGAGIEPLPFATDQEGSRQHINAWVSDKTEALIPDLIPQGSITPETVMVLVNALYLKAQWASQFDVAMTADGPFTLLNGSTATVPFMHDNQLSATTTVGDGYTAIDLPYAASGLSMLVIVPDSGNYDQIESGLGTDFVSGVEASLEPSEVDLYLPKFESETAFNLRDAIEGDLGVTGLFMVPELGGIGQNVVVTDALHAAKIKVDESGTEAAAATAIVMDLTSMPSQVTELRVDRPFIYLIRDAGTGAVLFIGRVLNPSS